MKKLLFLLIISVILCTGCPKPDDPPGTGEPTPVPGPTANDKITELQYALFNDSYTPIYSATQSGLVADAWTSLSIPVDASNIGYDGFDPSGPNSWTALTKIRLQILTGAADDEVLIYFDNFKMTNGSNTPISYNYDSSTGSYYTSKGDELTDNNTLQTIDSQTCVEIHGKSKNQDGSTGFEFQYDLASATDCSGEDYTISFDYYMPSTIQ